MKKILDNIDLAIADARAACEARRPKVETTVISVPARSVKTHRVSFPAAPFLKLIEIELGELPPGKLDMLVVVTDGTEVTAIFEEVTTDE